MSERGARRQRARNVARALLAVAVLLPAVACSDGGGTVTGDDEATPRDVLSALADGVVIPSYEALVANLTALGTRLDGLCTAPGDGALDAARASWRDVELAWQSTRASGVGPAIDQRAMGAIAFGARADKIATLLDGRDPLGPDDLGALGSDVRGIYAAEIALFGVGAETLATPDGDRRCRYAGAVTGLARAAGEAVLDAWTGRDGSGKAYRDRFVEGMDGDAMSSVEALVSEVTFRLQQTDDQGLRTLAAARTPEELPPGRREGPATYGVAGMRGVLGGVAALVLGPDGGPGLAALVRARSAATAERLEARTRAAVDALRPLPDSSAAALEEPGFRAALHRAAHAVAELRVVVATEVASQLGVTIGFSDADGDS